MQYDRSGLSTQDKDTRHILSVIKAAREDYGHAIIQAAEAIESYARDLYESGEIRYPYRLSSDQYRCIEQGYTKDVPLWVVLIACRIYGIGPSRLLGDVLGEYGY